MVKGRKTGGRKKGTPNRIDKEIKERFADFLLHSTLNIEKLWDNLEKESARDALNAIKDFAEFVLPKQSRVDNRLVDEEGKDRNIEVTVNRIVRSVEKIEEKGKKR